MPRPFFFSYVTIYDGFRRWRITRSSRSLTFGPGIFGWEGGFPSGNGVLSFFFILILASLLESLSVIEIILPS